MAVDRYFKPGSLGNTYAGTDVTRAAATQNFGMITEEYDDYSDLSDKQIEFVKLWMQKLKSQYVGQFEYVGNLVKDKC